MPKPWDQKGCPACGELWHSGRQPPEIGQNETLHHRLHRCATGGTSWEQTEWCAGVIGEAEAQALFPEALPGKDVDV